MLNPKSEIVRHKARVLVANCFHQKECIDFKEVYAPVVRI